MKYQFETFLALALAGAMLTSAMPAAAGSPEQATARQILATSGVKGGLVVHLGCSDGMVTAALRANDSYVVQGLDPDAKQIAAARKHIESLGAYFGRAMVGQPVALHRESGEPAGRE